MPFARVSPRAPVESASPRAVRRLQFAGTAVLILVGVFCALLLAVRFVVFPQVESHRAQIAAYLSSKVGQTVEIDSIATGWDGWNPRLSIRGVHIRDRAGLRTTPLLELPRVDLIVAWTSLPLVELRLRELIVDGPRLSVRRDAHGRLRIAGIAIEPDQPTDDTAMTDWLLRQREIVVRNALIVWDDELRNAPQLVLDQVQIRLERTFGHHRFGLTGTPPAELAAPLDLRGDIVSVDPADWQRVLGRFYLRLDYADVAAWREWLPLPLPVESGKGALRMWVDVAGGQPRDVVADLELADVDARLAQDLPPLGLTHLAGRIRWKHDDRQRTLSTRALTFQTNDGAVLPPTDLTLALDDDDAQSVVAGKLAFPRLDLAPLTAVAAHLPLPERLRHDLARFAPRGTLIDGKLTWQGDPEAPRAFTASGAFERLGVNAQELFPGADGVTGSFAATEGGGSLKLASRALSVALPHVFAEPLALDSAIGNVSWKRASETLSVTVGDLAFANAHGAGTASGTWHSLPNGPGAIDLRAQLNRMNAENVHRYMPLRLNERVREWVHRALIKGTAADAQLVLKGNLADFPFAQNRGGQFLVTAKAQGASLDYADHWPVITDIDADVRIEGTRMIVDAARGRAVGAQLGHTRGEIADMADPRPILRVAGEANTPTSAFLAFVAQSPVAEWTGHFGDHAQATGDGQLALKFELPLKSPADTKVDGDFGFADNQLRVGSLPAIAHLSGKLHFSETDLTGNDIAGEIYGGPVKLRVAGADNRVQVTATGTANVASLRADADLPLADRVSGIAEYMLQVSARPDAATWVLETSLKGVSIDLPAPLGKSAEQAMALRVERREGAAPRRDEIIAVDYGSIARLQLRAPAGAGAKFDRALLTLGKAADKPADAERGGLWVRAEMPTLNVDDWLTIGRMLSPDGAGGASSASPGNAKGISLEGADLDAATMQALGRKFNDLKVVARRSNDDWRLALDGREVAGTAVWRAPTPVMPNGLVVARLVRLTTPGAGDLTPWKAPAEAPKAAQGAANPWPEIDLTTEALWTRGRDVGKLEVSARPSGTDWQIESLKLRNDEGSIDASGWWRAGPPQQTMLDIALDTPEAGAFLARFGMPDAIRGAPSKMTGQLSWAGSPSDFDYPSLAGSLTLTSGAGQFLKVDPGVGRLLGVLSLQSLPRRISLDFRDVFSEGFAFDSVTGAGTIAGGVMSTDNLHLAGPAATVDISGSVDMSQETQKLRVRVQPALSTSISAGAAALFIANPLIGAAVGAGTLLAQKILKDPIEQLFSYEYAVSGGWSDPVVQRVGSRTASAAPTPAQTVTQ
jgi:uncharacterized protein (TIGR02099 family)